MFYNATNEQIKMYENRSNAYQYQPWKQKYLTHKLVLQFFYISSYEFREFSRERHSKGNSKWSSKRPRFELLQTQNSSENAGGIAYVFLTVD